MKRVELEGLIDAVVKAAENRSINNDKAYDDVFYAELKKAKLTLLNAIEEMKENG